MLLLLVVAAVLVVGGTAVSLKKKEVSTETPVSDNVPVVLTASDLTTVSSQLDETDVDELDAELEQLDSESEF